MRADPALGFPPGTPDALPETVSWHGFGHVIAGMIGFAGLIVACCVLSRWFGRRRAAGWSRFSLVTGVVYFLGLAGLAAGAGSAVVNLGFTVAVILGWTWITMLMLRPRAEGSLR
jgi:hypothetical protein